MKHIAAYLLLQLGGNASPSTKDITNLLATVGIDPDTERLEKLISELEGKSISDLIAEGSSKLSSVPSGGAAVTSAGTAAGGGGAAAPAAEEAKPEEKVEEKEESDDDMGFGLFD